MDKRIGAQYYTIREQSQNIKDFEAACKKVKEIGYKIVQISGQPMAAAEMRPVLDDYDLKVVTTHRGFDDFLNRLDWVMDYNRTLGCELCGVGSMPKEYRGSSAKVSQFIDEASGVAEKLKKEDLYFGYHNHAFEFAKLDDGKRTMDRLISETDPESFMFIADTYWMQYGGVNPADFIRRLGSRAMAVHFKDMIIDPEKEFKPEMAEIGEGNLDWDDIVSACDEAGVKWALVEQDRCKRDPMESLKMSYDYLCGKGFN